MVETFMGATDLQIRLLTAVGQLAMAGAVAYVAYRQWRTAEQQASTAQKKLKADLFDRRLTAFDQLQDSIAVLRLRWPSADHGLEVVHHGEKFGYLFGQPAAEAVVKLGSIATLASSTANELGKGVPSEVEEHPSRLIARKRVAKLRLDFESQVAIVRRIVAADLKLSH